MTNEELDRLEALARTLVDDSADEDWYTPSDLLIIPDAAASFIAAASPDVVLRLVAELREARDFVRNIAARVDCDGGHRQSGESLSETHARIDHEITRMLVLTAELAEARAEMRKARTERDAWVDAAQSHRFGPSWGLTRPEQLVDANAKARDTISAALDDLKRSDVVIRGLESELADARSEIALRNEAYEVLRENRDKREAERDQLRAEVERLQAMVPSESTTRLVRQWYDQAVIALASIGHLLDDREAAEKQLATAGEWLARIESAKEKEHG